MRIAIIGAGISGMACAHELERLGIKPDIYERKPKVGELFPHVGALLQIINRPVKDPLKFLKERYFIDIKPLNIVNEVAMYAPSVTSIVKGKSLGYLLRRGQADHSVEHQLFVKLKTQINFLTEANVLELAGDYDYVIVASGNPDIPMKLGVWQTLVSTWVRGAVVLGDFDPSKIEMWLDTEFAKQGYAYLCPFDEKAAILVLVVTEIKEEELEAYWRHFWKKIKFPYIIVEEFVVPHISGFVFPHQLNNILFTGNAGGFLEPFLGFGQYHSVISGVTAARCIIEQKNYEAELEPFLKEIMQLLELRRIIDKFNNKDFDKLVRILGIPGINQFIYNTNFNVIKHSASILEVISKAAFTRLFKGSATK